MSLLLPERTDNEMSLPLDRLYTREHVWVRLNEDTGAYEVGVCPMFFDDFDDMEAEVVFAECPTGGDSVAFGEECAVLESVKSAQEVMSPITGTVDEYNHEAEDDPEIISQSPFESWLFAVMEEEDSKHVQHRLKDQGELMSAAEYQALLDITDKVKSRSVNKGNRT